MTFSVPTSVSCAKKDEPRAVCNCVYGTVARVVYSRTFPGLIKPQTVRLNKLPHTVHAIANRPNQWLPGLVLGDLRKKPMIHQIPFGGSWRETSHRNSQTKFISHLLQAKFPEPRTTTIWLAAIGSMGLRRSISLPREPLPIPLTP